MMSGNATSVEYASVDCGNKLQVLLKLLFILLRRRQRSRSVVDPILETISCGIK